MDIWWRALFLLVFWSHTCIDAAGVDSKRWSPHISKLSGVIIPGFASTRLRAWAMLDCPFSPLDFRPLDPVWLDTRKVISVPNCWLKCMLLEPYNQTDNPECKSRPDSGLTAITELDPGYITGPLSSIWREWVDWCVEFGIEADAIIATPYDWRLSGSMLEERDLYFHRLKLTFETALKLRGGPSLVFAHSLGNNVFRYFLEWLKLEIAPRMYQQWLDDHIYTYFAVGSPFLGSVESVKAALSGLTFGLPISEGTARLMCNSFSSSVWMLPCSRYCDVDHKSCKRSCSYPGKEQGSLVCSDDEFLIRSSGWPVDIVKVEVPDTPGDGFCASNVLLSEPLTSVDCSTTTQWSFSAREVADGTFFNAIEDHDIHIKKVYHQLRKYFIDDPVLNPLTPWQRPPLKNIFCIYGIDVKTEVGYHYALSGKPYPDSWILTDVIYETEGGTLQARSGSSVKGNQSTSSGDGTVPYHSLSWCKNWLGASVNITRTPQRAYTASDVQECFDIEHANGVDIVPNMTRDSNVKYITFYEDGVSIPGKRTAVWEIDKVDHRNIVRLPAFLRELWLETSHGFHPDAKRHFVSKVKREPIRDEDCFWDYSKARCGMPDCCEYRYVFGDVHLGQSCRLRASSESPFQHYL